MSCPKPLSSLLETYGQSHLLEFWDALLPPQQKHLQDQIESIDFQQLRLLLAQEGMEQTWSEKAAVAEPPPAITLDQFRDSVAHNHALKLGGDAIAAGKVAMVLTAGGQGSRLGFDHPKGMFPIGPISRRSLYQIIIEKVAARAKQFGGSIPFYVMTSPPTHFESSNYLTQHERFGYPEGDFRIFCQGVMPAVDSDGKIILAEKHSVFQSPDGHGGTIAGLVKSGYLQEMLDRGVEYIFYGQVDNPLIQACDPALIGFHIMNESEMTTQVIRKNEPLQKVGNVVSVDGNVQIIEYSDLPDAYAKTENPDGSLRFWAGSIAVHVFNSAFLDRVRHDTDSLPFHRAQKKVPYIDSDGKVVQPEHANATKFEKFIFDLLPKAKNAIVCEVEPEEGFCAVKNAAPASSETPEHVKKAISDLHRKWLTRAGVSVAEGVAVEINPFRAVDEQEVAARLGKMKAVVESTYFE